MAIVAGNLSGAAPKAAQIDLAMSGNLPPVSFGFVTATRGPPTDLGATWLNATRCNWIEVYLDIGSYSIGSAVMVLWPVAMLCLLMIYIERNGERLVGTAPSSLVLVGIPILIFLH